MKLFTQHQGFFEVFSIMLPEKFKIELSNIITNLDRYKFLLPIISWGFQWCAIEGFPEKPQDLVFEGLSNSNCCATILNSLCGIY
jgi:hypothetical protein